MKIRRIIGLAAAATLLAAAPAASAHAAPAETSETDVFKIAAQVEPDGADQAPAAIPAAPRQGALNACKKG